MIVEQAGLEIDDHASARLLEPVDRRSRFAKLVPVPREHVATLADARVARAEVKRRERNVVFADSIHELREPRLRVGRVGQAHCGIGITQAPARPEGHTAGQLGERADDIADPRADEEVVVEIAVVDLDVTVEAVIVVVLATEIECRRRKRVVEETVGDPGRLVAPDHERPVLVQRVGGLRVVSERVERERPQPAPVLVERSGLVAEAEVPVGALARHAVTDDLGALAPVVGGGRPIARKRLALRAPAQTERPQRHRHRH